MKEVDPKTTKRAFSYEHFINSPMPMVTIFKTLTVTPLWNWSQKGAKFTMLMSYCIGRAAAGMEEFMLVPEGRKLIQYDSLRINIIVANKKGGMNFCDVPFDPQLATFNTSYLTLTRQVAETCQDYFLHDTALVGISCLVKFDIDGIVNQYGTCYSPFLSWGKYQDLNGEKILKLSFQFHHVQMDGVEACTFLDRLQAEINTFTVACS